MISTDAIKLSLTVDELKVQYFRMLLSIKSFSEAISFYEISVLHISLYI